MSKIVECEVALTFLISPDVSTNSIVKVFIKQRIAVWPLSGFSEKCVDEKTTVERSQSRTGNSIVRGILQVSVKKNVSSWSIVQLKFKHMKLRAS